MSTRAAPVPHTAPPSAAPLVAANGRLELPDLLRGFALLGMLLAHVQYYTGGGGRDAWVQSAVDYVAGGKFYTLFALLFGIGFGLQLLRAEERGERFALRFLRRLAVLWVIGFALQSLTGYKVLLLYALWGVPLLLVRRWSDRALLALAVVSLVAAPIRTLGVQAWYSAQGQHAEAGRTLQRLAAAPRAAARERAEVALTGTYPEVVRANARAALVQYRHYQTYLPDVPLALFALGLVLVRRRVLHAPREHTRFLARGMAFGAASVAVTLALRYARDHGWWPDFGLPTLNAAVPNLVFFTLRWEWLAFTYAGGLALLVAHHEGARSRLTFLGWAGRMALTNYVVQVALLELLFARYHLALPITPTMGLAVTVGVFGAQALVSRWWLGAFRHGPLEWAWRCLTDLRWHPVRREDAAPLAVAA